MLTDTNLKYIENDNGIHYFKMYSFITLLQGTRAEDIKDEKNNYHKQVMPVSHGYSLRMVQI